jgi:hypothetical protein
MLAILSDCFTRQPAVADSYLLAHLNGQKCQLSIMPANYGSAMATQVANSDDTARHP